MPNLLVIMADELSREGVGCYDSGLAVTPNMDAVAARGLRFTNAYTPSPVCVPARAAFATGRYVHKTRCWSNAEPYHGQFPSWGHLHRSVDRTCVSAGKLHFRSKDDDNGFDTEIEPLHVRNGIGFIQGLLRKERRLFETSHFADEIGPGDDPYTQYDLRVCAQAVDWIKQQTGDQPWTMFASFLRPHYPLTCPPEFFDIYNVKDIPPRRFAGVSQEFAHPVLGAFRTYFDYDDAFDDHSRQVARASYFGLCSFVDDLMGKLIAALNVSGQLDDTIILITSDHGELNGEHGLWTKMTMHEESVAVPLIIAGPGIAPGVVSAAASLVDVYATVAEIIGADPGDATEGQSLLSLGDTSDSSRCVFSEYHDGGAITAFLMARTDRWKYIHYPGFAPQLFDIESDPHETEDLGLDSEYSDIRAMCLEKMRSHLAPPEDINDRAFSDQAALIERLGGVQTIINTPGFDFTPVE